jgi:predicted transcriptional regulator
MTRELKVKISDELIEHFNTIADAQERDRIAHGWPSLEDTLREAAKAAEKLHAKESLQETVNSAVATFVTKKKEYGNTDEIVVSAMKALYPSGVPLERYYEAIFTLKILEKLSRLSSTSLSEERLRDAYKDVVGYGLLGVDAYNREIENKEKPETT